MTLGDEARPALAAPAPAEFRYRLAFRRTRFSPSPSGSPAALPRRGRRASRETTSASWCAREKSRPTRCSSTGRSTSAARPLASPGGRFEALCRTRDSGSSFKPRFPATIRPRPPAGRRCFRRAHPPRLRRLSRLEGRGPDPHRHLEARPSEPIRLPAPHDPGLEGLAREAVVVSRTR